MGRDDVGNPLWREDPQTTSHSEHYWYDAADRLTDFKRGTLNAGKTDISTYTSDTNLKQRQQWSALDALGNWDTNAVTQAGTTLTENRTNNKRRRWRSFAKPGGLGDAMSPTWHGSADHQLRP